MPAPAVRVSARNATFQRWQTLLTNRTKRHRAGEFVVQGVRPISAAVAHGWVVRELLYDAGRPTLSRWARGLLDSVPARIAAVSSELIGELGEKDADPPELLAVVAIADDDVDRIPARDDLLVLAFDRPSSPGNLGTLIRSADALGAHGLLVTGHAADPYDPRSVRASVGSLFALPVVRLDSPDLLIGRLTAPGARLEVVGLTEDATDDLDGCDLRGPTVLVVGNEATGLSSAWRAACTRLAAIPMSGTASSLNAATAGGIALYEAARQRGSGSSSELRT
jgi:TrmH family RNA methyltransferase